MERKKLVHQLAFGLEQDPGVQASLVSLCLRPDLSPLNKLQGQANPDFMQRLSGDETKVYP